MFKITYRGSGTRLPNKTTGMPPGGYFYIDPVTLIVLTYIVVRLLLG